MADLINLNKARKRKQQLARQGDAAANRLAFGRDKAARQADAARTKAAEARLDAHRLDRDAEAKPERDGHS